MDTKRGKGQGGVNWEAGTDTYTLLCIKGITNENVLYSTGELYSTLCGDLNGKETPKRGYMYTYSSFAVLYSRNQHNTVKQLYSNTTKKKMMWEVQEDVPRGVEK